MACLDDSNLCKSIAQLNLTRVRRQTELKQEGHLIKECRGGLLGRRNRPGPIQRGRLWRRGRIQEFVERLNLVG